MNKVVLVTGAGSGIGKAIALKYAEVNVKMSIADINAKGLQETAEICSNKNENNILNTVIDMTKDEDVKNLVDFTVRKFGTIDVLINCAGIFMTSKILDQNLMDGYDKVMAANLRSVILITSLCAPHLIRSKGSVMNIASVLATITTDRSLIYNVSKSGLDHFTRCAALDLAAHGVRVNAILPGSVKSNIYINSGMTEDESEILFRAIAPITPLKRVIETNEIAELVMFLTSENARSITGSSYIIDSGTMLTGLQYTKNL